MRKTGSSWEKCPFQTCPSHCFSHDVPASGHQGVDRTKASIKSKYYWWRMTDEIRQYVLTCRLCSCNKTGKVKGKVDMRLYHAGSPMERVHIDFVGPLPKTKRGNEYILMMVDQFTKWIECVPLPSQTADVTDKAAVDEFFCRFGNPFELFSDQGQNFDSQLFAEVCKTLQIHRKRTTPYRPSGNGQCERYNRTLMDSLRCFLDRSSDDWDEHLSAASPRGDPGA